MVMFLKIKIIQRRNWHSTKR